MQFTPEQQKVIDLRNKNILVSAAAGSGKTAVLVERILGLILDKENPVDIDRLLIVTFTNAAASEMRERIGAAIESRLTVQPENQHLQRQSTLLHHAQITTIDSFCLFVIRNNFNEIGLDPGFRVADSGEMELLKQDIINEIFEELLEKEETKEDFINLIENLAFRGKEKVLEETILKIYNFSQSFPWPKEWLQERYEDYVVTEALEDTVWGKIWKEDFGLQMEQLQNRLRSAITVCMEPDGPGMYVAALESDLELVDFLKAKSWQEQYERMQKLSFARLSAKKDAAVSPGKKERVKAIREEIKKEITGLSKKFFSFSEETIKKQMEDTAAIEKTLIDTVLLFQKRFEERKREKNILDFHDMEHMALDILIQRKTDENTGEKSWEPTKIAKDYASYFKEIMIDEYQDSNLVQEYLLQSISGELENKHNRFMVGDLKQSIYKFRLARPEIFLEKYHSYSGKEEEKQIRIDLHKNFRSRKQVIDSVNHVFYQIMGEALGKIEYTEKEALYPGAVYDEGTDDYTTELLLLDKAQEDVKKAEAVMVAGRIKQLVGKFQVTDKETGKLRQAKFGDIVVLLRSNAGWDEEFYNVFMERDIPACVTSKTGYFSAKEVQILLSFLKVIDNPKQDIPLYGTMKSLLGRFTEEEIVQIKGRGEESLYDNLKAMTEGELGEKAQSFLESLSRYRDLVYIMPIHKLLRVYLKETGYLHYFAGLTGGEQRIANVKMLLEKAENYEKTSYFGLFHFIRYMEQLQKYDIEASEAGNVDESQNVVRIMSIHKSKGLEFPICIVAGLSKKMNQQDVNASLVCDMDLGIGMEYRNAKKRVRNADMRKNVLAEKMRTDNLGEELRILYVAMTRAKEKLIMSGVVKDYEESMLSYEELKQNKKHTLYEESSKQNKERVLCNGEGVEKRGTMKIPYGILSHSTSLMDFVLPTTVCDNEYIKTILWNPWEDEKQKEAEAFSHQINRLEMEEKLKTFSGQEGIELWKILKKNFSFIYEHDNLQGLYAKITVSELKMKAMEESDDAAFHMFEEPEAVSYVPAFVEEKGEVSGTTRGNAYHRIMELLDFSKCQDVQEVFGHMEQLVREKILDATYLKLVNKKKLNKFLQSVLAERMQKAAKIGKLYREQPFVLGISADRVNEKFPPEEKVLIQGIIDAFFEEEGELVLVDYKTDAIKTGEELIRRYETQVEYYKEALEKLTGKRVKETILYSFALSESVVIS